MRTMAKTMTAAALLAMAACGAQDVSSEISCTSTTCPPNLPFFGTGNLRSCHQISDPTSCYLETGDGVIYDCVPSGSGCDCTQAQTNITAWCNTLK